MGHEDMMAVICVSCEWLSVYNRKSILYFTTEGRRTLAKQRRSTTEEDIVRDISCGSFASIVSIVGMPPPTTALFVSLNHSSLKN